MDDTSTTDVDNSTAATADPITSTGNGTDTSVNNSNPSQSTDNVEGGTTTNTNSNDESASTFDTDLDEWIEKRGLAKADSDEQHQAYQDLRNGQREFTREQQSKREAADAKVLADEMKQSQPDSNDEDDDDVDPLEKRQDKIEQQLVEERTTRLQSEFYTTNKVTEEQHKAILEIYKEKVSKPTTPEGKKNAFELWSKPDALNDLLDIAKARILNSQDTSAATKEAARQEREKIAKESNASSPGRGARTVTTGNKSPEQERLQRFSTWD